MEIFMLWIIGINFFVIVISLIFMGTVIQKFNVFDNGLEQLENAHVKIEAKLAADYEKDLDELKSQFETELEILKANG